MVTNIVKWISLPVLMSAAPFSGYLPRYELLLNLVICLGALVLIQSALRSRQYLWAAGLLATAVLFSPLTLVVKIFLLMGFACVATIITLVAAFHAQSGAWLPEENRE